MESQTVLIINRVLPILALLTLGYLIRRRGLLTETQIEGLRTVVVNLALPAVIFLSFLQIEFQASFVLVSAVIFFICIVLYLVGRMLGPRLEPEHPYFPYLMTGFEYGMLGVSLFGSAYGLGAIGYIAVMDLGHEIFIWFVFLPLLLKRRDGLQRLADLAGAFIKSPVAIAIVAGVGFNLAGLGESLKAWPITGAAMITLEFLGNMTIPLILIVVGYGIKLDRAAVRTAARLVGIRLAIVVPLVIVLILVLVRGLFDLGQPYEAALFTLFILPPPFIIPLFMRQDDGAERRYVNNVLTLYTVVSIVIFTVYFIFNPTLAPAG